MRRQVVFPQTWPCFGRVILPDWNGGRLDLAAFFYFDQGVAGAF